MCLFGLPHIGSLKAKSSEQEHRFASTAMLFNAKERVHKALFLCLCLCVLLLWATFEHKCRFDDEAVGLEGTLGKELESNLVAVASTKRKPYTPEAARN